MALPKLEVPKYMMTVPSTGDEIEFRPFLVREEKILLLAMEEQTEKATHNAVLDLVHSCTFGSLGKKNDPMFDIEYAFIKIRSKSVSETIDVRHLLLFGIIKSETERVFFIIKSCIQAINFGEETYNIVDISKKELNEFVDSLTQEMFEKLQNFFSTMPRLRHVLDVENPKTGVVSQVSLEGLGDFLT